MFVSWNWISELVDTTGVDPKAFADRFTLAVAEIEGVVDVAAGLDQVVVADVVAVSPHPNADKLRLADCDLGHATVRVVCGAPDLRVGMRVPFVPPGVTLPSGIEVRHGEVRGVPSPGMLASEADLGLSEEHAGLLELHGCDAAPGTPLCDAVPIRDVLYEIDNKSITHRPDLWGHLGMAREVAALLDRPLLRPSTEGLAFTDADPVSLGVSPFSACRRYLCARFEGVVVAPSPVAVRLRLRSLGVRPISNVVDATNLVMLETGNPLHAFDARHVRGDAITVRQAVEGETLVTLDGVSRGLTSADCVIVDEVGPVALAGVMGGANSEISGDTTAVVLEAASFDGAAVRKTASRLGMRTESSARFEKHLDPETAHLAALRFAHVLLRLSPGSQLVSRLADVGRHVDAPPQATQIHTRRSYLRSRLGLDATQLTDAWMDRALTALEFDVQGPDEDALVVTVPSFRAGRDVGIAEDLVEELGRVYGYDHIPSQAPRVAARPPFVPPSKPQDRRARAAMALGCGLTELVLYSFESESFRERVGLQERGADGDVLPREVLRNHLSSDMTHMRRLLSNNLLAATERNLLHGTRAADGHKGTRVGLFELGRAFVPVDLPREADHPAVDWGLPAPMASGDAASQTAYLANLNDVLREGVQSAVATKRPLPWQPRRLAIAIGERLGGGQDGLVQAPRSLSVALYREAVGAVESLCAQLQRPAPQLARQPEPGVLPSGVTSGPGAVDLRPAWLHPARHATVAVAGRYVGLISLVHPEVRGALEVPAEVVLVELDLDALLSVDTVAERGEAPARFPPSAFDLTLPCQLSARAAALTGALHAAAAAAVDDVDVDVRWVSEFVAEAGGAAADPTGDGDPFPRAMTFRFTSRRAAGSLTDDDVRAVRAAVLRCAAEQASVRPGWAAEVDA